MEILGAAEIELMREAGLLAAATLRMAGELVAPGVSTDFLDKRCHEFIVDHGAYPAPLNYHGFPKSICTSVNEVVCHGIPHPNHVLREGDIINIDVTALLDGFHGDTSATYYVGEVSDDAIRVTEAAREALDLGIAAVRPGGRLRDIGNVIEPFANSRGCSVVRDYCGHGIGRHFHSEPQVMHYRSRGTSRNPHPHPNTCFPTQPTIQADTRKVK